MPESRRVFDESRYIPVVACVLLVTLRLFIGWQFLYEGLWKVDTLDSPQPWTAEGYLKNAQGPFRDVFRGMTGDPDDLLWLDAEHVAGEWDAWADRFTRHYGLDKDQQARLNKLLEGPADFRVKLAALPPGASLAEALPKDARDKIKYDPGLREIIVDGRWHLSADEKDRLLKLVPASGATATGEDGGQNKPQWELAADYETAITRLYNLASTLSYKERLLKALGSSDPERVRVVFGNFKGTIGERAPEKVDTYYREMLAAYEAKLDQTNGTDLSFQREHLAREWKEIQELRAELVNPIKALDAGLKADAFKLLKPEQIALGTPAEPWSRQRISDMLTIVALCALGALLIAGLGTRAAAVLGAGMLLSFYLVMPPWPGVPAEAGPEHSFIVNKNLIEAVALLAIAALPTGRWFGIDGLIYRGWRTLRGRRHDVGAPLTVPPSAAAPVAASPVKRPAGAKA